MGSPLLLGAGTFAPPLPPYDPDAQAFFTAESAAGVTLTSTQMTAVNDLVINCKAANIWTKLKALYPIVGGTATAHKFNLKNPADTNAAFRLVFTGGWTHSATGMLPNGTNAYADTFLIPSTNLSSSNNHQSIYLTTNTDGAFIDIGSYQISGLTYYLLMYPRSGNLMTIANGNTSFPNVAMTDSRGFFLMSKLSSSTASAFKNNAKVINNQAVGTGVSGTKVYLGASNNNGTAGNYSNRQITFASMGDGLTDIESQLLYQIIEKFQVALGRSINPLQSFYYNPAYNNETNAFLFSTQITDLTIQTATDTLVSDLKTTGVWTKMRAVYPMVGGTATTHKYNLKDPQDTNAAFRLNLIGGWTHSSTGALPNGTNAYAQTFLVPGVTLGLYLMSVGYYSRTNSAGNFVDMGVINGAASNNPTLDMYIRTGSDLMSTWMSKANATGRLQSAVTDSRGFFVQASNGTTTQTAYKNGVSIGSNAATGLTINTYGIFLAAENGTGTANQYSNRECAFSFIGDGFSSTDVTNLNIAVQAFNTTLGRQV